MDTAWDPGMQGPGWGATPQSEWTRTGRKRPWMGALLEEVKSEQVGGPQTREWHAEIEVAK